MIMAQQSSSNNIDIVNRITCRIETPYKKGTAVLLKTEQTNTFYLLTAKHCLLQKEINNKVNTIDVKVSIPCSTEEKFLSFNLEERDEIHFPPEDIDAALIVLTKPIEFDIPFIELAEIRYTIEECFFRGYPQAYGALRGITVSQVRYTDNNQITTSVNLSTLDSDPLYNCQGFSGGGVFCDLKGQLFLTGLLYKFEEPFQLFSVSDLSFLKGLLSSHELPDVKFSSLPLDQSIIEEVEKLNHKTELVLGGINSFFGKDFFLKRKSIDNDFDAKFATNKLVVIKGDAGTGKSAYAKAIILRLLDSNYSILAFKADTLARDSIEKIFPDLGFNFYEIFRQIGQEKQVVVLIDSFEKLLEVVTFEALKEFLRLCKTLPNIKIIITCRTFAYQQLLFELYNDFPKFDFVDVSPLDDRELLEVEEKFPFLQELLKIEKYKHILRKPFYLNLVILNWGVFKDKQIITEKELRRIIWDHIIDKHVPKRGSTFEEIALQRAKSMSLYTRISDPDPIIISQLRGDGIIIIEENLSEAFSPSHDIYEDIALIRFVERVYQEQQHVGDFLIKLGGKEPAIRRAFRLWVNDQLLSVSTQFIVFLSQIINSSETDIEQYWKDELIIAILRSEYCEDFIQTYWDLLKGNHHKLFLRMIHLLQTTCQEPDEKFAQNVRERMQNDYWMYLKPEGPGWKALIQCIYNNLSELNDFHRRFFHLITNDWSKKLNSNDAIELPGEAKAAGAILFSILDEINGTTSLRRDNAYSTEDIKSCIQVLFRLSLIFRAEIQNLIETADSYPKRGYEDTRPINFDLREFYDIVIDHTLSGLYNKEVCKELPDLVAKVAVKNWLKDETKEKTIRDPFGHRVGDSFDIGRDFGLTRGKQFKYFPAGIYKTPLRFLLFTHPRIALNLIVRIINHITDAYAKSARGKNSDVVDVRIHNRDGSVVNQTGNVVLWGMYRGLVEATPDLLQSILMSLESWLLELCRTQGDWVDDTIENAYNYLLKASLSVATTSVLASIAMAYPKRIGKLCLPILEVKEFYSWDTARLVAENVPLAPIDIKIPFAQEERYKSNLFPHRKLRLEDLVTKLQVEGYWEETNAILDHFICTYEQDDKLWKLALNRMDIRKYEVDVIGEKPEQNQIVLKPKIDKELIEIVDEAQEYLQLRGKAAYIANWAIKVYEGKDNITISLEKWRNEYQDYRNLENTTPDFIKPFECSNYLAAIGVRLFNSTLPVDELIWCIDTIEDSLNKAIASRLSGDPSLDVFLKPAVQTAPFILSLQISEEKRGEIKEIIFLSLIFLVSHEMEYPFESIRNNLWSIDSDFADFCLAGMIEYAKLKKQKKFFPPRSEEEKMYWAEFLQRVEVLVDRVCKGDIGLDFDNSSFETHSHWYLGFAVLIIPFDTKSDLHIRFIKKVLGLILGVLDIGRENHTDLTEYIYTEQNIKEYLARFLLSQSDDVSQELFSIILDYIFSDDECKLSYEAKKYIIELVEQIIVEEDTLNSPRFWDLWELLESKIKSTNKSDLISSLFLSIRWWTAEAEDWKPLSNKKLYIRKLIIELDHNDICAVVRLLSGIGTKTLLPEGITWLKSALNNSTEPLQELSESKTYMYSEKLIQRIYYRYIKEIRANKELRESYLYLLDHMINLGSSLAFIIRERIISVIN
jgi:hypothetical protein